MQIGNNLKGITQDINDLQRSEDSYSFVLNGSVENYSAEHSFPFIGNTPSNIKCLEFTDEVIGFVYIPELDFVIMAFKNPETKVQTLLKLKSIKKDLGPEKQYQKSSNGCITIVTSESNYMCEVQTIFSTNCLNWDISSPLQFEYKITDCTLNLYFINGLDEDRFLYLDLNTFEISDYFKKNTSIDDCNPSFINDLDCSKTVWYPLVTLPCINTEVISGGNKLPGRYNYLVAYSTNKGIPLTSFQSITQGADIFNIGKNTSEKGIKITLDSFTQGSRYRYYTIAVVETIKGVTTYRIQGTYPVSQTIVFDLQNSGEFITVQELVSQYPFYKNSSNLTVSNNILFKSNLIEFEKFNLQPLINKVELNWITGVLKEGDYKNSQNHVSYMRDEVYPLGVEIILSNTEKGPTFPFVGRKHTSYDITPITDLDVVKDSSCVAATLPRWRVRNTALKEFTNSDSLNSIYNECSKELTVYERGVFGYHESTETYPNEPSVWGDLCGQPIRHFRFPDHTQTLHHNSTNFDGQNYIFPLGVEVKTDMTALFNSAVTLGLISQEQRNRIIGWKLVRGNRLGNKTIVAKGLLYDMWKYDKIEEDKNFSIKCTNESTEYFYPNYPFNDLNDDPFLASTSAHYKKDKPNLENPTLQKFTPRGRYTFHSPDTHFTEPDLGTTLKIEAISSGDSRGFFNIAQEQAEYKILSWKHFNIALSLGKWIANTQRTAEQEIVEKQAGNIGSSIGSAIGSTVGLKGAGNALGGMLGSFIGGSFYKNSLIGKFTDGVFKATITFSETEKFINIFKNIVKYKQYHYQYQAVGKYNTITSYNNYGNKQRHLDNAEYLDEGKYTINNTYINNFNRESSVYLKVNSNLPTLPANLDTSRVLISDNSQPSSVVITETVEHKCSKWYVRRNSYQNIRLGVWGTLCFKQKLTSQQIALYSDYDKTFGQYGGTYVVDTISNTFNGITHLGSSERAAGVIQVLGPEEHYIIEELIWVFNTHGTSNVNPANIDSTDRCYQFLTIKPTRGVFDTSEEDNKVYGEEHVDYGEVEDCVPSAEQIIYTEEKGCNCNRKVTRPIASYYGSIKQTLLNQYGSIFDINWLSTSSCLSESKKPIFGGDTFISRFTLKRKHSFFNNTTFGTPNDFEINYSLLVNTAYPVYYFDTNPIIKEKITQVITGLNLPINYPSSALMSRLFPVWGNTLFNANNYLQKPKYKLDCDLPETTNKVEFSAVEGLIYLYNYGISSFIVESEINVDLRDIGNSPSLDFYPHTSDLSHWLQEKIVKPVEDNAFIYDKSYSKQPNEEYHYMNDINFKGNESCEIDRTNRIIYTSEGQSIDDDDYVDNFLINKALDYHDFSKKDGKIVSIEGLEGDKVLVRQEDTSSVFGAYIEINTNQATALISAGNIFKNKPIQFSRPTLGYFGSQHRAILHTPFGHVSVDAKRGYVFLLANNAQGLEEISNKGMKHWFKENLPFTISKFFPKVNIDNTLNGIGISLCYDSRFNSFYLTKLDFKPIDSRVCFNEGTETFYLEDTGAEISLEDTRYFCNKSFTISYNFYTQQWQSFHSFTPRFYIDYIDHFDTGIKTSLWKHNITNKDYQRYYGTLYPFIVETLTKADYNNHIVKNVNYLVDVIEYFNNTDYTFHKNKSFNKAIVYNETQNSGLLELENVKNNLSLTSKFPILAADKRRIILTIKENFHSFNQFRDIVTNNSIPLWNSECGNVNKNLNLLALNSNLRTQAIAYIRSLQNKIRLIQDKEYAYQYIFKGTIINDTGTSRI